MKFQLLFLIICFPVLTISAQINEIDSLKQELIREPDEANRINLQNIIARRYLRVNIDSTFIYATKALELADSNTYPLKFAYALNNLGIAYYYYRQFDTAIYLNEKALNIYEKTNDSVRYADVLINLGNISFEIGNYSEAQKSYERSLFIYKSTNHQTGISKALNNLGNALNYQGKYRQALDNYFKALNIETERNNTMGIGICQNNIGNMHVKLNNYQEALKSYQKAEEIYKKLGNNYMETSVLNQIAISYDNLHQSDTAIKIYLNALDNAVNNEYHHLISLIENNIGDLYFNQQKYHTALKYYDLAVVSSGKTNSNLEMAMAQVGVGRVYNEFNKPKESIKISQQAYDIAKKINAPDVLKHASITLSESYEQLGNTKEALHYYKVYKQMNDTLLNAENIKKITGLQWQYNFDKMQKELELEQHKKELEHQAKLKQMKIRRQVIIFFSLSMIIVLILILLWYRKNREAQISKLHIEINRNMQRILGQQMNPHFIFNTLKSIQYFILNNDIKESNVYLTRFSKLIRRILENSQYEFISVKNELDALELYMQLENVRLNHKFAYTIDVDSEIDIAEYKIPSLLLQPYVENAIWHGLANKEGIGEINIKLVLQNEAIQCIIYDNGIGRKKENETNVSGHTSLGSKITKDRIKLINELYKADIQPRYHNLEIGTKVEFLIPVIV